MPTRKAAPVHPITALLEDVLGCKWSWSVLRAVHAGTLRPGQLERAIPGISTKVLNERLRKLVAHGILDRHEFMQLPARVEYSFTALGTRFFGILQQVDALERERAADPDPAAPTPAAVSPNRRSRRTPSSPAGRPASAPPRRRSPG